MKTTGNGEQADQGKSSHAPSGPKDDKVSSVPRSPPIQPSSTDNVSFSGVKDLPLPPMTETVNGLPDLALAKKACTLLPVP
jgi:hypothetical protein